MLCAPDCILNGIEKLKDRSIIVRYEDLIANTDKELEKLCELLGIEYKQDMNNYGLSNLPHWPLGDQEMVYMNTCPNSNNDRVWRKALNNPQVWRLAKDYLEMIGAEKITKMGYNINDFYAILDSYIPNKYNRKMTFSLNYLLSKPPSKRNYVERYIERIVPGVTGNGLLKVRV